jgi:hypothetical protein
MSASGMTVTLRRYVMIHQIYRHALPGNNGGQRLALACDISGADTFSNIWWRHGLMAGLFEAKSKEAAARTYAQRMIPSAKERTEIWFLSNALMQVDLAKTH